MFLSCVYLKPFSFQLWIHALNANPNSLYVCTCFGYYLITKLFLDLKNMAILWVFVVPGGSIWDWPQINYTTHVVMKEHVSHCNGLAHWFPIDWLTIEVWWLRMGYIWLDCTDSTSGTKSLMALMVFFMECGDSETHMQSSASFPFPACNI